MLEPDLRQTMHESRQGSGMARDGLDLLGAIGLSITATLVVVFAGEFVITVVGEEGGISRTESLAIAIAGTLLSLAIARATQLPVAPCAALLGLATAANALVQIVSTGGESDVIGLPASFIEAAILSGVPFGVAWMYTGLKRKRPLSDLGFVAPASPIAYLRAISTWFIAMIGVGIWGLLVTDIDTIAPPDNATPVLDIAGGSLFTAWLLVGLWGPFVEEVFFRGFLLGSLLNRFGHWPALLVSSGTFALFHIQPGLYVPTFLLGLAFGWVYLKTRSIWPAIFGHTLHNTVVLITVWQEIG